MQLTDLARRVVRAGREDSRRHMSRHNENVAIAREHATEVERRQLRLLLVLALAGGAGLLLCVATAAVLPRWIKGIGILSFFVLGVVAYNARVYLQADIADAIRARQDAAPAPANAARAPSGT